MGLFPLIKKRLVTRAPLVFRNALSGELEEFVPLDKEGDFLFGWQTVRVYGCGPTAYAEQHIGNLFPPVLANVLHRTLETWGYRVVEVNNITDFGHLSEDEASEDKMTKGLRAEGLPPTLANMRAVAEKYAALYFGDLPKLGIDPKAVRYPRASDYVPQQIELIKILEQKGFAYKTENGVYFDRKKFRGYGKLGNINFDGQLAGARVEVGEKRNPQDFVLWKPDKKLGWQSPWGLGFPGWHTECVAMIFALLGKQIDIHLGGVDLIPVHHNNEIAQAEAATEKAPFVRYWLHNAFITMDGQKIAKSIGNVVYLSHIIARGLDPRALRYWFLTGHYSQPMNFTWEALEGAAVALKRLQQAYARAPKGAVDAAFMQKFYETIAKDLDTPNALATVWENISTLNQGTLAEVDKILGLELLEAKPREIMIPEEVKKFSEEREAARQSKDFARADQLRKKIEDLGFSVSDTPHGPQITKK